MMVVVALIVLIIIAYLIVGTVGLLMLAHHVLTALETILTSI